MEKTSKNTKQSNIPLYLSIAGFGSVILAYFFVPQVQAFFDEAWSVLTSNDEQRIQRWVNDFGWFGPILLILAMIVQMFLLVIPSILLMVVSILAYGPIWGSLIILISVYAASSVGYIIGKYFGDRFVTRLIGEKSAKKIENFLKDYGIWAIIVTRINPFLSNDAISFVGGLLRMGYWKFIAASLIGITPLTIFIAVMGKSTDSLKTGLLWGSSVCLVIFILYIWWDKQRKKSKK